MATVSGAPYVPQFITVHLGSPDSNAQNVTVAFQDYIKNVASSEIYPTWSPSAIRANVLAQISYALNRVYLEYYRSRGYNFDITNSTAIDQSFVNGRNIFENIEILVDEIFDSYIRRQGFIEPLAAKYCNGTTSICDGLSQWGSQQLAEQGLNSIEILRYYYGDDIEQVLNAPVMTNEESYPGSPLSVGSTGQAVITIQTILNRVAQNYPLITKISPVDGVFGSNTEEAVSIFQGIFNLTQDGVVGRATWYKLILIYAGVKRLSELNSEGQKLLGVSLEYPDAISKGNTGEKVEILQYFLDVLSDFYLTIPPVTQDGLFGDATENSVIQAQKQFGLPQTGVVDDRTWDALYEAFKGILNASAETTGIFVVDTVPFAGDVLRTGSTGNQVSELQKYINAISIVYSQVSPVVVSGSYGAATRDAVVQYQMLFGLPVNGEVDAATWNSIANTYKDVVSEKTPRQQQFPGTTLAVGSDDSSYVGE